MELLLLVSVLPLVCQPLVQACWPAQFLADLQEAQVEARLAAWEERSSAKYYMKR